MNNVKEYKYLGVYICDSTSDDRDIKRQLCATYGRATMLIRKIGKCSDDVKHNRSTTSYQNLVLNMSSNITI